MQAAHSRGFPSPLLAKGSDALKVLIAIAAFLLAMSEAVPVRAASPQTEGALAADFDPADEAPPSQDVAAALESIHGANYIPSYAASPYETWDRYDGEVVRRELAAAARIGIDSVRVWLSYSAYEGRSGEFVEHWSDFIRACRENKLTVLPVLFDSRGVDPEARLEGTQITRAAYERFLSRPGAYRLRPGYKRFLAVAALELQPSHPIPNSHDPGVVYWGEWSPSPDPNRLGEDFRADHLRYLADVVAPHARERTIVAWEVVNEPGGRPLFSEAARGGPWPAFSMAMVDAVREIGPSQPLTVGLQGGYRASSLLLTKVDFVSLHLSQRKPGAILAEIAEARRLSRGMPILVGEGGACLFPASAADAAEDRQTDFVRGAVMAFESRRVGYYVWQLVQGRAMTPWTGLLDAEGEPKPAALWLKDWIRAGR